MIDTMKNTENKSIPKLYHKDTMKKKANFIFPGNVYQN